MAIGRFGARGGKDMKRGGDERIERWIEGGEDTY
jgi:hypothetical protein